MIKSMTGYGKSTMQIGLRQYQVEIKSVNHRYSDVNIKMPRVISYLEEDVKKQILSKISSGRGSAKYNRRRIQQTSRI